MTLKEDSKPAEDWLVYMIEASDTRLYTGITNNMPKRWHAHTNTKQGAKFFRGRAPKRVQFIEAEHTRSSASKREYVIKQLTRAEKLRLINQQGIDWHQRLALPTAIEP